MCFIEIYGPGSEAKTQIQERDVGYSRGWRIIRSWKSLRSFRDPVRVKALSCMHWISFLGVDQYSSSPSSAEKAAFLARMQSYMSRHHRNFLHHLSVNPRPLRTLVSTAGDPALLDAYNAAVQSLREFRDAHMIIVTLYILLPAKRARAAAKNAEKEQDKAPLQGTGGTDLVSFLKGVRDRTTEARIVPSIRM